MRFGGCHATNNQDAPINVAGGSANATFSTGGVYSPGQSVSITVSVTDPQHSWAGFQMTARPESDLANGTVGHFRKGPGQLIICSNNSLRFTDSCLPSGPIEFIEHSEPSQGNWTFTWTAPDTDVGPIHFYLAGNAVNNDGEADTGDHVYTNAFVLQPAPPVCNDQTPTISAAIVASGFGGSTTISAGNWIEIYGQNLSVNPFRDWTGSDFNNNVAPTSLEGVTVKINNKDAFVRFVSPGQVNVFSPDDDATGPVEVEVTNCAGSSAPFTAQKAALSPGIMATGTHTPRKVMAFDPNSLTGLDQVQSGSMIVLFGVGFGPTDPGFAAGTAVDGQNHVTGNLKIAIGGVEVPQSDITYAGLLPSFVGLYQFNVKVPNLPAGSQAVTVTIDGVAVPGPLTIQLAGSS